ncbi:hypothetical protein V2J09_021280 [Rumex salicifolius]
MHCFHVIDVNTSYNALLRRPWLHASKSIVSTLHQCYIDDSGNERMSKIDLSIPNKTLIIHKYFGDKKGDGKRVVLKEESSNHSLEASSSKMHKKRKVNVRKFKSSSKRRMEREPFDEDIFNNLHVSQDGGLLIANVIEPEVLTQEEQNILKRDDCKENKVQARRNKKWKLKKKKKKVRCLAKSLGGLSVDEN